MRFVVSLFNTVLIVILVVCIYLLIKKIREDLRDYWGRR